MKRIKTTLNQHEVERLIYNDLDVMAAYPDHLDDKEEKEKLKKRLKELLVEGEFVEDEIAPGYVLTNFGRIITGKRKPVLSMQRSNSDIFVHVNARRWVLSEMLPNFDYKETLGRLKELKVPVSKYDY